MTGVGGSATVARMQIGKRDEVESISSEELVRWCQRTLPYDQRAFEVLIAQYQKQVFRTAYHLLGNQQDAEDAAQDVFLKVYRGIGALAEPATLPAWIHRITTNHCLNMLTRQRRRPTPTRLDGDNDQDLPPGGTIETLPDTDAPTPEGTALSRELQQCIESVLAQLQPLERATLVLRDIEDRPYDEIAASLRVGLSAAKMRIRRARQAFQELFARICPDLWSQNAATKERAL